MTESKVRILAAFIAALAISWTLLAPLALAASKAKTLELEPLFGLLYDPQKVFFAKVPKEIFRCSDLKDPPRKLYLFGQAAEKEKSFFYVYGLIQSETGEFEAESDDGIIVVLTPSGCDSISAGYAMSPREQYRKEARKIGINDEVLNRLLSDAVERETKAFGGAERFLDHVDAAGLKESTLHPRLRAELLSLRKQVQDTKSNE